MVYGLHACGRTAVPMAPTRDMRSAGYCFRRRQTRCGVCSVPGRSIYGRAASVQARCLTASGPTLRRTHRRGADGRAGMHLACRRACICCPGTPRFPWMHAFLLGVFLTRPGPGFFFLQTSSRGRLWSLSLPAAGYGAGGQRRAACCQLASNASSRRRVRYLPSALRIASGPAAPARFGLSPSRWIRRSIPETALRLMPCARCSSLLQHLGAQRAVEMR